MRKKKNWKWNWYLAALLAVLASAYWISTSRSYEDCKTASYQESAARRAGKTDEIANSLRIALRCEGVAIDENAELLIAVFTGGLWLVTLTLWLATKRLAEGAEEASRHQLRAYLVVEFDRPGVRPCVPEDGHNMLTLRITNSGETPAEVTALTFRQVISADLPAEPRYVSKSESIHVRLGPGQSYYELKRFAKEVDKAQSFIGYVDYADMFGGKWRVGYGLWFKPNRDVREAYGSNEEYAARTNLIPIGSPGYNYERERTRKDAEVVTENEPEEVTVASTHSSKFNEIYTTGKRG